MTGGHRRFENTATTAYDTALCRLLGQGGVAREEERRRGERGERER